ncbi:MAG: TraB/GumN family protein [Haliscomenobacter sp.]|nr:TraB/GumN family protein [Haliscomenobacter sp.]
MKSVFKRPLLFFPLFFIVLQALTAQTSGGVSADGRSLLWEIKGKSLSKPSYLYGTIHLIGKSDFFITEATEKAFGETQRVAFEIDLEDGRFFDPDAVAHAILYEKRYDPERSSPARGVQRRQSAFQEAGFADVLLDRIKPMFLTALDPRLWRPRGSGRRNRIL